MSQVNLYEIDALREKLSVLHYRVADTCNEVQPCPFCLMKYQLNKSGYKAASAVDSGTPLATHGTVGRQFEAHELLAQFTVLDTWFKEHQLSPPSSYQWLKKFATASWPDDRGNALKYHQLSKMLKQNLALTKEIVALLD